MYWPRCCHRKGVLVEVWRRGISSQGRSLSILVLDETRSSWGSCLHFLERQVQSTLWGKRFWNSVDRVRDYPSGGYMNQVVQEIRWVDRLDEWNHTPPLTYFLTHYVDSMPIGSIGGALSDVLFNPKYAGHILKLTVAIDSLGNIVSICHLAPGTSADVLVWYRQGPQRTKGHFKDYEFGCNGGAYKGRIHIAMPFIGCANLTKWQQEYNDVHGNSRARVEDLFGHFWHWGLVRNIWRGNGTTLHKSIRILVHLTHVCIRRQVRYPPYGPWPHVPPMYGLMYMRSFRLMMMEMMVRCVLFVA